MLLRILLFIGLSCTVLAAELVQDEDDWVDPLDLFSHDPTKVERDYAKYMAEKKKSTEAKPTADDQSKEVPIPDTTNMNKNAESNTKPNVTPQPPSCEREKEEIKILEKKLSKKPAEHGPYFKQYVARIVRLLDKAKQVSYLESSSFMMSIEMNDADIDVLRTFATGPGEGTVQNAHAVLDRMYRDVRQVDIPEGAVFDWQSWIVTTSWAVTAFMTTAIAINLTWRFGIPWGRLLGAIFVFLFLISIPWTWWRLYKEEIVKRMASFTHAPPPECNPESMTIWQSLRSSMSLSDKCEQFYASLHIDPWMDVTPTKAMVVTVSKFVLDPMQYLGEAVSKMVVACLKDLPGHLWPVALGILIFICVMLMVMCFGYRINLCYLLDLSPTRQALPANDKRVLEQLTGLVDQVQRLTEGNSNVKQMLTEQRRTLDEQLGQPQLLALPSIRPGEPVGGPQHAYPEFSASGAPYRHGGYPEHGDHYTGSSSTGRRNDSERYSAYPVRRDFMDGDERIEEIEVERPQPPKASTSANLIPKTDNIQDKKSSTVIMAEQAQSTAHSDQKSKADGGHTETAKVEEVACLADSTQNVPSVPSRVASESKAVDEKGDKGKESVGSPKQSPKKQSRVGDSEKGAGDSNTSVSPSVPSYDSLRDSMSRSQEEKLSEGVENVGSKDSTEETTKKLPPPAESSDDSDLEIISEPDSTDTM